MKYIFSVIGLMSFLLSNAQNVGIGETAPANKLSVKGSISIGSGYSTTAAPSDGAIIQGNVGIGTASPSATLHIISPNTTGSTVQLRLSPTGAGGSSTSVPSFVDFYSTFDAYTADQNPRRTASIKAKYSGGVWGTETLLFEVGGAGDAGIEPTERMRINAAGYVGIGNSSPSYNLDVTGTGRFTGNVNVGGNLTVSGAITGRVWSTNLASATNYGSTATAILYTTVNSHGGNLVITGKVYDQTNNNNANRNTIYLYRTTSSSAYNGTGSTLLDTWSFWQSAGGAINESAVVTYSEQLSAGTYYYWLVGQCEVSGQTRTALTAGTRLIVYEF